MTQPDDEGSTEFPVEWGYRPAPAGAVEAAVDVFASSMSDEEFDAFVQRVRPAGGR